MLVISFWMRRGVRFKIRGRSGRKSRRKIQGRWSAVRLFPRLLWFLVGTQCWGYGLDGGKGTFFLLQRGQLVDGGVLDVLGFPDQQDVLFDLDNCDWFDLVLQKVGGVATDGPEILIGGDLIQFLHLDRGGGYWLFLRSARRRQIRICGGVDWVIWVQRRWW